MLLTILIGLGLLIAAVVAAIILFLLIPIRYPILNHSDLAEPGYLWRMYYAHKYLFPIRKAFRGSGREAYFAGLDFAMEPPGPLAPEITISAVGDLMWRPGLSGVHPSLWEEIGAQLFGADLSIGNMEFAVNPRNLIHKTIRYSVSPDEAQPLLGDPRFGRFSVVSVGNNHVNDSLHQGITSTLDHLDTTGILHVGANRTPQEQDAFPIVDIKGARIAVLSYTFSTNGIPVEAGYEHGVNVVKLNTLDDNAYDPGMILRHIALARSRGATYIIACLHWGVEFEYYPPERIVRRGHDLLDAGIDLIIGHHPHILNPVDRYRTKDGRDGLIFYSLGNATAHALLGNRKRMGMMARVKLTVDGTNRVRPTSVGEIPFMYTNRRVNGVRTHRLLAIERPRPCVAGSPDQLSPSDVRALRFCKREFNHFFRQSGITVE